MDLCVERPSHMEANITWNKVPSATQYHVIVKDIDDGWKFVRTMKKWHLELENLEPGDTYSVTVKAQRRFSDGKYKIIKKQKLDFHAVFTSEELEEIYEKARKFVERGKFDSITWLYRNKPKKYFDKIFKEDDGIMEVYEKDDNGDAASIINGAIDGLFFATFLDPKTRKIPTRSVFGSVRFCMPALKVLADHAVRLYFADFYCINQWHYVTLVLTHRKSETDKFCRENLIELDIEDNDFLHRTGQKVHVNRTVHVEVLYTEDIDINEWEESHGAYRYSVTSTGTSTPGGLRKDPDCEICNLDSVLSDDEDEDDDSEEEDEKEYDDEYDEESSDEDEFWWL